MSDLAALLAFALIPGLAVFRARSTRQDRAYPQEVVIATLYLRSGRLVLRRAGPR